MPTLNWIGKEAFIKHHKEVPFLLLGPAPDRSCGPSDGRKSGNLIVQGDNLHALKSLPPRYAGQVKCICIDPPYNTGNEGRVYNDNVNSPEIREWLGKVVGNEGETLDRHDRWLSMMYLFEIGDDIAQNKTRERVRRAIEGYTPLAGEKRVPVEGLGGGFQFCHLSAEPLFDAEGQIRSDVSFAQLAEFVWFAETGTGLSPLMRGKADSPLLGVHEGRAIYLLYNGILEDRSAAGGNVLTVPVFDVLPRFAGPKVIYAAANRMGARAVCEGISFKQTPCALEV